MDEHQIRSYFAPNWVFRLYLQKQIAYPIIVIGVPVLIVAIGAIIAAVLGVLPVFATNYMAYAGPLGIVVALSAYGWFAMIFPRFMERLAPAFEVPEEQFAQAIQKWTNRLANHLWVLILFSIPIAGFSLIDLLRLWASPELTWTGTPWVLSNQSLFFALYFGFYNVVVVGFLLGSGAAGILVSVLVINSVLALPLKLDYYRRLQVVGEFSGGLSLWALAAFLGILLEKFVLKPTTTVELTVSAAALSALASVALLAALIAPVMLARQTLRKAKARRIAIYENRLYHISETIDQLLVRPSDAEATKTDLARLDDLRKEQDEIGQQMKEVESISDWPLNWLHGVQIIAGAFTPLLSFGADFIQSKLSSLLPK